MEHKDKGIGFAADLVPLVKDGSKQLTYRLGDKYSFLQVGDIIPVKDSSTNEVFGKAEVTNVWKTTFKDLPIDFDGHEKYESKDEQRKVFEIYYPGRVKDDSPVVVIGFRILS